MERLADRPALRRKLKRRLRRRAPTPTELAYIEAARRPPRPPSAMWGWALLTVGGMAGLQLGLAGLDALDGAPLGAACLDHHDCDTGLCLKHLQRDARYCSRPCEREGQCAPTLSCGSAARLPEAQHGVGAAGPLAQGDVCIRIAE